MLAMEPGNRGREAASLPPLIDFGEDEPISFQHQQSSTLWSHSGDALSGVRLDKLDQTGTSRMPIFSFASSTSSSGFPELVPTTNPFLSSSELTAAKQEKKFTEISTTLKHQGFSYSSSSQVHNSRATFEPPDLLTGSDSLFAATPINSHSPQIAPETADWSNFFDLYPLDNPLEPQFLTAERDKPESSNEINSFLEAELAQKKSSAAWGQSEHDDYHIVADARNKHANVDGNGRPGDFCLKSATKYLDAQSEFECVTPRSYEEPFRSLTNLTGDEDSAFTHSSSESNSTPPNVEIQLLPDTDETRDKLPAEKSSNLKNSKENGENSGLRKWNSSPSHSKSEYRGNVSVNEDLTASFLNKGKPGVWNLHQGFSLKMDGVAISEDFFGAGVGERIFKALYRGAVHPSRPVSLELRPRPSGDQRVDGTKVLICSDTAVWAGCDFGLMVWNIDGATADESEGYDNLPGDQDAAACVSLPVDGTSTLCLATDAAKKFIWSGQKDGYVRAWHDNLCSRSRDSREQNSALFMWQAHQTPVLSLVVTSYGELWTGSENGSLKAWILDAITDEHLSLRDRNEYTSIISPKPIDIKPQGIPAGAATLMSTDIQFLISEHANGRVWSGGSTSLSLWDARTRCVLKVFGPNSHPEFLSSDFAPSRDDLWDADVKLNYTRVPKKEKSFGGFKIFQRSKNAVMGAADAVRRAAVGVQGGDDSKKLEALTAAVDGTVWGGFANGTLIQWDGQGNRLRDMQMISVAVKCICVVGTRIWVGYADGRVQVIALDGENLSGGWLAHNSAVIQMARGGNYIFTLATHGGIRGWLVTSPSTVDVVLHSELSLRTILYTKRQQLSILAATWNVSEEKASTSSLQRWLARPASKAGIVFIGLQEMEMGAGAIAKAAAKETVGFGLQGKGTANAQWWLENLAYVIGEGQEFKRIGSRQLAGIFIGVWVRRKLLPYLGDVDTSAIACGFGRALGNKGAVGVRIKLFRRTFCFVSSHFAAHMDAVLRRNADFEHIYCRMSFGHSTGAVGAAATAVVASVSTAVQILRGSNAHRNSSGPEAQETHSEKSSPNDFMDFEPTVESMPPDLSEADLLVWVGDLNYRIDDLSYEEALTLISEKRWEDLIQRDQLRTEMAAGRVFQGMREGAINFPPTYKFDKGNQYVPGFYDSSEKRRVPAWCDRVLFRDSFSENENHREIDLSHPVMASVIGYGSCMEAADSDHKPVWCLLDVDLAAINEAARRRQLGELISKHSQIKHLLEQLDYVPKVVVNTEKIILEKGAHPVLKVSNESRNELAIFLVHCEGNPDPKKDFRQILAPGSGFPAWLQVQPAAGLIYPNQYLEITVSQIMEDHVDVRHNYSWDVQEHDDVTRLVITCRGQYSRLFKKFPVTVYRCPSFRDCCRQSEPNIYLRRTEAMGNRWDSQDARTFAS